MRKIMMRMVLVVGVSIIAITCKKDEPEPIRLEGTVTDPSGQVYKWKEMNDGKIWMVKNLNYDLPGFNSWWYDNDPANGEVYGRLYDFEAAEVACTTLGKGWKLPTSQDWDSLVEAYGGWEGFDWDNYGSYSHSAYRSLINGGASGFSALFGGRHFKDSFYDLANEGHYWSQGEGITEAYKFRFVNNSNLLYKHIVISHIEGSLGWSCRCVKDVED